MSKMECTYAFWEDVTKELMIPRSSAVDWSVIRRSTEDLPRKVKLCYAVR